MTTPAQAGALAGIRVLDLTAVMAGPFAARMLADNGAEVIKVEPPGGDLMRSRPPLRAGHSSYCGALNCGKRSIVLDLKHPGGRAIARGLARTADVVIENFRPGVVKQLGLDYATLSAENSRLVYCSVSGFGQTGPSAGKPAYAPIIHAASGYDVANLRLQDATDRPANTGIFLADVLGAVYAFGAIQTALLHRERTGVGQSVDVSMLDAMVSLLVTDVQEAQFVADRRRAVYPPLKTLGGGYIVVAPTTPRNFAALCAAIDRPDLLEDPRFATIGARGRHWELLFALIEDWTSTRTAEACEEILCSGGVPCSRYREIADALRDPQLAHRGALVEVADDAGPFLVANQPYLMSETPARARPHVAGPGGDAEQILRDLLDCTDEEIAGWRTSGALGDPQPEHEHA
jgi:CoA:oxalate CoA-transferase